MGTHKVIVVATNDTEEQHKVINTIGLSDAKLSWKAKGMHAYIRTNGDGWLQNQEGLVGASRDGRDAVRAGIRELLIRKYLHKATIRDGQGRIKYHAYISTPTPMEYTAQDIKVLAEGQIVAPPQTALPAPGNPLVVGVRGRINNYPLGNINYTKTSNNTLTGITTLFCTATGRTALSIIHHWNSLPNLRTHKLTEPYTKTIKLSEKTLTKALKHHSPMVIKKAMERYNEILTAPNTTLTATMVKKQSGVYRVPLYEFFKWTPKAFEIITTHKNHPLNPLGGSSWFKACRQGMSNLITTFAAIRKDKNPNLTQALGDAWGEIVMYNGTPMERNNIRFASERLERFFEKHQKYLRNQRLNVFGLVPWLKQYLTEKQAQGKNIHTGWLTSDLTWHEFAGYLVDMAVTEERRRAVPRREA